MEKIDQGIINILNDIEDFYDVPKAKPSQPLDEEIKLSILSNLTRFINGELVDENTFDAKERIRAVFNRRHGMSDLTTGYYQVKLSKICDELMMQDIYMLKQFVVLLMLTTLTEKSQEHALSYAIIKNSPHDEPYILRNKRELAAYPRRNRRSDRREQADK